MHSQFVRFFMWYLCKSVPSVRILTCIYAGHWHHACVFIQLNRSSSSIKAAAEFEIDNRAMRLKGQASQTKLGFKQVFELYHSFPQVRVKFSSISDASMNDSFNNSCCSRGGMRTPLWLRVMYVLDYFCTVDVSSQKSFRKGRVRGAQRLACPHTPHPVVGWKLTCTYRVTRMEIETDRYQGYY